VSGDDLADYRPCVGILLINDEGKAWVGRRIDMPAGLSAWQMPQGGIDPGETPIQAALRELYEETGTNKAEIIAESGQWLYYDLPDAIRTGWGRRHRGQKQKWFLMRFIGQDIDIDLTCHEAEFDLWKWIEPRELPGLVVEFKRAVYVALLEEFAAQLGL
jgi:putative (di)nucleoside polyphosphate hydrolase